jgi:hypothetical protein
VLQAMSVEHPRVPIGLALRDLEEKHRDRRVLRPDALHGGGPVQVGSS